jgi:mannosyl-3-phosphoglycerate synthase
MRLTSPPKPRRFGQLQVAGEVSILELDAHAHPGLQKGSNGTQGNAEGGNFCVSSSSLDEILSEMVIVVPCKDEDLDVIRGVIAAIPHACLVILVSNCKRAEDDAYEQQVKMVHTFAGYGRQILVIHQKDSVAAAALQASRMSELLDPADGRIRNGKGEGMLLAIAIAEAFCPEKRYVGFVDADNFIPATVSEYCTAFAAGFAMSRSPEQEDTLVRLRWNSKPKIRNGKVEKVEQGRCSRIVNNWLNRLFASEAPGETLNPLITTANAGEHAMTMALAKKLRMAAGYAIEPFHFVDLLVRGRLEGNTSSSARDVEGSNRTETSTKPLDKPVTVRQIRTCSPHWHRESDDEHIRHMWAAGLGSIYHGLAPYRAKNGAIKQLCKDMHAYAVNNNGVEKTTGQLPCPRTYPALETMDITTFRRMLRRGMGKDSFHALGLDSSEED